jgi:ribosome-binding factor A
MPSLRTQRIRELLKREIGEVLRRELPVQEAGLVTVNEVEVSGDLQTAKVFISVLGSPAQQKQALRLVTDCRTRVQAQIGRDLFLKYTPVLSFVLDDSIERGNRVLQIIEELEQKDPGSSPA